MVESRSPVKCLVTNEKKNKKYCNDTTQRKINFKKADQVLQFNKKLMVFCPYFSSNSLSKQQLAFRFQGLANFIYVNEYSRNSINRTNWCR